MAWLPSIIMSWTYSVLKLAYLKVAMGQILGKFPWMSKIPLQGNGMAAIPKIKKIIKVYDLRSLLPSHKFMLDFSFVLALPQVPNNIE